MTTALIDGDIVAYRCSASVNKQILEHITNAIGTHYDIGDALDAEKEVAILRADNLMREILDATMATNYHVYLSGDNNFRKELYPAYKANRTQPKPMFLADVNQHLIDEWSAEVVHEMEADDALGINQDANETIIASHDKDLRMIPGRHYDFVKKEFFEIQEFEAYYNFYKQILTGDTTDNIPNLHHGFGPKSAEKALMGCQDEKELFQVVRDLYKDDERMLLNAQLLWIKRDYSTSLGSTSLQELLNNERMTTGSQ